MFIALYHHGLVQNKCNIFVFGGRDSQAIEKSNATFVKRGNTETWERIEDMPFGVYEFGYAKYQRCVIIFGGRNDEYDIIDSILIFDLEKEEWSVSNKVRICVLCHQCSSFFVCFVCHRD